ncbi:MAG: Gfo/Idh/MocA family protein [Gemmatimonadota bacterium]
MTRVGLAGLGNAARTLHLPALAGLRDVEIVGGCDPDAGSRERVAREHGCPTFPSLPELFERGRPEVVIVCTPPRSHMEVCLEILEAGAHVICEKPFATSVEEADRIIEAAGRTGRRVAMNHEFREMPIFRAVRDWIGTPPVGDLVFAQAWQTMDLPPWEEKGWRSHLLLGTLFEAGIHLIDYMLYLFGEPPRAVSAVHSSCGAHPEDSDAVALVTLRFGEGRLAQVTQNRLCRGATQYFEVRADCSEASLRASFGGRARLSAGLFRSTRPHVRWEWGSSGIAWRERGGKRSAIDRNPRDPAMVGTRRLLEKTLSGFREGRAPPASAEDGRISLEVLAACHESADAGREIELGTGAPPHLRSLRLA